MITLSTEIIHFSQVSLIAEQYFPMLEYLILREEYASSALAVPSEQSDSVE